MLLNRLKRLLSILGVIAITFIGTGLISSNTASINAETPNSPAACQTQANSSSGGFCDDAGCTGGDLKCYAPPQGGMCYTSENEKIKN